MTALRAFGESVASLFEYTFYAARHCFARTDVQMYTNDAKALECELSRDMPHPTAIQQEPVAAQIIEPQAVSIQTAQGQAERES